MRGKRARGEGKAGWRWRLIGGYRRTQIRSSRHPLSPLTSHLAHICLLAVLLADPLQAAQNGREIREQVREWRERNEPAILAELVQLLEIPNLASDRVHIRRNADHLVAMLARRGIAARLLEDDRAPPAVYGELRVPGASRTIVMYAHYDGQPVDTAAWRTPPWRVAFLDAPHDRGGRPAAAPYGPETRIYARSAGDDKSPIVAMLAALDALRARGISPGVNLKFFLEGEEEAGSPNLGTMLTRYRDLLAADAWLFADGPLHQSRRPQLVFGVRGTMNFQLTVYGPLRPLHSGHYGNWAPNPGVLLSELILSMRDADGRVHMAGFYDDARPVTEAERRAIAAIPPADGQLRAELGLAATEAANAPLLERLMLPALNVQGIEMARVGAGAANVISPSATAAFGVRLVPDMRPERVREVVLAHLRGRGWHVVDAEPDSATRGRHPRIVRVHFNSGGYPANRTDLDAPVARAMVRALQPALDQPLLLVPTSGGSLPLYHFTGILGVPVISFPTVNHDNNQHGSNENLRLADFRQAIELFAVLFARLGAEWPQGS